MLPERNPRKKITERARRSFLRRWDKIKNRSRERTTRTTEESRSATRHAERNGGKRKGGYTGREILLWELRGNTSPRKSIGRMSLPRANKPRASARARNFRCNFRTGIRRARCAEGEEEAAEKASETSRGKKIVRCGIGSVGFADVQSAGEGRRGGQEVGFAFTRFEAIQFR